MISDKQNRYYWGLWAKAKRALMNGRETWTQLEENKSRHELHVRANRRDCSHYDFTRVEFDNIVAEFKAIIDPSDLRGQLRQANMKATRLNWGMRKLMRELDVNYSYVQGIVDQMFPGSAPGSGAGFGGSPKQPVDIWQRERERNARPRKLLHQLDADDLRKVMIALREHKRRGGGTVKQPRVYLLEPA